MKVINLLLVAAVSAGSKPYDGDKCRALAMRGGGTKGAYEVGALKAMVDLLDPEDIMYDVVEGVSVGGLNAGLFATYKKGEEKNAVDHLYDMWLSNPVTQLWENWSFIGPVEGLWR